MYTYMNTYIQFCQVPARIVIGPIRFSSKLRHVYVNVNVYIYIRIHIHTYMYTYIQISHTYMYSYIQISQMSARIGTQTI